MGKIAERAKVHRQAVRDELRLRFPHLLPAPAPAIDRSAIVLGRDEAGAPLFLPLRARLEHMHAIGTTGGGKSTLLTHCVRQDIIDGSGVLFVDPHGDHRGSPYRSLLAWLDETGLTKQRTIHLIDPNAPTHTVGFNPLQRPDAETDLSVIAGVALEAFERVWGGENTQAKPTIRRILKATFVAVAELGLTLVEAGLLYDPDDAAGVRAWAIEHVQDAYANDVLRRLDQLAQDPRTRRDFGMEVVGPINRLAEFVSSAAIRSIVGQTQNTIDLRTAMDEGHIVLANLSGGQRVYERDADLLGRLLSRFLFFHAKRRRRPDRPFFVYLDECHRYLSGDLENILAELRKFGVGAVLSHQWQAQLAKDDETMLAAVRNATNVKVVFRLKDPVEAADLADMVLGYNLEMPVLALTKPIVVGHRLVRLKSESASDQYALSDMRSETEGHSVTESSAYAESTGQTLGESISAAESEGATNAEVASQASATGAATGTGVTNTLTVDTNLFGIPTVIGVAEAESASTQESNMTGSSSSRGRSRSSTTGRTSSVATSVSSTVTQATAYTTSFARSRGSSETRGKAETRGLQEAFEPIYETLPTSVHSLENVRHMATQILCNLPTGRAAVSFVDASGMKRAALAVAHVRTQALPAAEFDALRERVFEASPSATRIGEAMRHISARRGAVIRAASEAPTPQELATSAQYRNKKKRLTSPELERRSLGQPNAAGRQRRQERPMAVASGDRDP
jgi:DNA helicase HerA-like ATPase